MSPPHRRAVGTDAVERLGMSLRADPSEGGGAMAAAGVGMRTLPLRVAPLTGQALDAVLETLAARHQVPLGDVLARCQLSFRAPVSGWIAVLTTAQLDHVGQM